MAGQLLIHDGGFFTSCFPLEHVFGGKPCVLFMFASCLSSEERVLAIMDGYIDPPWTVHTPTFASGGNRTLLNRGGVVKRCRFL